MLTHPVAVTADIDHVAMMHQAVDQRGGHDLIAQDTAPLLEALVGGQDRGGVFVARVDELEEQHGAVAVDR